MAKLSKQDISRAHALGIDGARRCVGHALGIAGNPTNAPEELREAYERGYKEGLKK